MLTAVLGLGQIGLVAAIALGWASKKFAVEVDAKEMAVNEVLPGVNCGACGYAGCSGYAGAVAKGEAPINLCPPGGSKVVADIARIMGIEEHAAEPQIAVVMCQGDRSNSSQRYIYTGMHDCNAANNIAGGPKQCQGGCLGLGSCVKACPFNAIEITAEGLAVISREHCTGCGKCLTVCPRSVIRMTPAAATVHVLCNSHDKGGLVRKYCEIGCIGCNICRKTAPEAFTIDQFLAQVDYAHDEDAALGIDKCPQKCILDFNSAYPHGSKLKPVPIQAGKDLH